MPAKILMTLLQIYLLLYTTRISDDVYAIYIKVDDPFIIYLNK
jgi:hypothetical protein